MILTNLNIRGSEEKNCILIKDGVIYEEGSFDEIKKNPADTIIEFENAVAFPGLINSHDHLEFSLFPMLGNGKYEDYIEWGDDIHKNFKDIIDEILKIPLEDRTAYGIFKNIISGVTTVVHHGNFPLENRYPIDIFSDYNYIHSVRLDKAWFVKLNFKPNSMPFVIHIGEGTNAASYSEINKLIRWNLFNRSVIGVHGIVMDAEQAERFKGLVWCPVSNDFLYGSTCRVDELKNNTTILFGTDSNVSADWNIWHHLRYARNTGMLDDIELYRTVTSGAVDFWALENKGSLAPGFAADLVIADKTSDNFFDSFYGIEPQNILMVIKNGDIILFDSILSGHLRNIQADISDFTGIMLEGRIKFIRGGLGDLCRRIKTYSSVASFPFELVST